MVADASEATFAQVCQCRRSPVCPSLNVTVGFLFLVTRSIMGRSCPFCSTYFEMRMIRAITSCVSKRWNAPGSWHVPDPSDDFLHLLTKPPFLLLCTPVAIAVGCDVFRPDARTLVDALIDIQSGTTFPYLFFD
ncbi:hypothetical protein J3R83DRAFT_8824 [Lanmaoa asiatica]|nr:hypothetical protein J3R83DRAFT_8824 [Lanmaoa asiatica]